jgi:hypothetical protein
VLQGADTKKAVCRKTNNKWKQRKVCINPSPGFLLFIPQLRGAPHQIGVLGFFLGLHKNRQWHVDLPTNKLNSLSLVFFRRKKTTENPNFITLSADPSCPRAMDQGLDPCHCCCCCCACLSPLFFILFYWPREIGVSNWLSLFIPFQCKHRLIMSKHGRIREGRRADGKQ